MSRGPGRLQREIVLTVTTQGEVTVDELLTRLFPSPTQSQRHSFMRAIRGLEARGQVKRASRKNEALEGWQLDPVRTVKYRPRRIVACTGPIGCLPCIYGVARTRAQDRERMLADIARLYGPTEVAKAEQHGAHHWTDYTEWVEETVQRRVWHGGWEDTLVPARSPEVRQQEAEQKRVAYEAVVQEARALVNRT